MQIVVQTLVGVGLVVAQALGNEITQSAAKAGYLRGLHHRSCSTWIGRQFHGAGSDGVGMGFLTSQDREAG
jgi:hypothetical protein